jgi:ABC-type sugar transport system ATPase subunit
MRLSPHYPLSANPDSFAAVGAASDSVNIPRRGNADLLEMHGITKRFGATVALRGVDFAARQGEVHALLGQNGSGKSTLMKVAYGEVRPDEGEIFVDGSVRRFKTPREALRVGIAAVAQELPLALDVSVAENVLAGRLPTRGGFIDWQRANETTASLLMSLRCAIDPRTPTRALPPHDRQMVAIAHALNVGARILIFDEPTSSLDVDQVDRFFDVMHGMKERGIAVILITQRLAEVHAAADRVTALRDGREVASCGVGEVTPRALAMLVAGETPQVVRPKARPGTKPLLEVRGLNAAGLRDATLTVRSGEILGVSGLVGSGRSALFRAVFGAIPFEAEAVVLDGVAVRVRSPSHAVSLGLALVTGDRAHEGLARLLDVEDNLLMVRRRRLSIRKIDRRSDRILAASLVRDLGVRAAGLNVPVSSLSGGNQQKVVLGKWLARTPRLLLLDEPTRGIDVAAKADFHAAVAGLAAKGVGVVIGSLDDQELLDTCSRIIVMRHGRIVAELDAARTNEQELLALSSGVEAVGN